MHDTGYSMLDNAIPHGQNLLPFIEYEESKIERHRASSIEEPSDPEPEI